MQKIQDYILPVLSLIVGVLVLLPTAIGPVGRPFVFGVLLPVFIILAIISVIALVVALIVSNWDSGSSASSKWSDVFHGIGNFSAMFSLLVAAIFLSANYREDYSALPRIVNVKINPVQPEAGKFVEVELDIVNRAGSALVFDWEFDGKKVAGLRTAYIKMPQKLGAHLITASVAAIENFPSEFDTGASESPNKKTKMESASTVRIWLDVVETDNPRRSENLLWTPQSIVQFCNNGVQHGNEKQGPVHGKTGSRPASAANRRHC